MQPDCDLLPIKGMFVSQLNPLHVLFHSHHFAQAETDVSILLDTPEKYLPFRLDTFRSVHRLGDIATPSDENMIRLL